MPRYCFCLDLRDDPALIAAYDDHHRKVWPAILASIQSSGITAMEIYRVHTRLFMIMETTADFSFEKKAEADAKNPVVQEWETLMWQYQQPLPFARPGEKWQPLQQIFDFKAAPPTN